MRLLWTRLTVALWLAGPATLFAQSFTASLMGTIKDNTGSVVPGVAVTSHECCHRRYLQLENRR